MLKDTQNFVYIGGFCDNGTRQSPIDIPGCSKGSMPALRLTGHNDTRQDGFTLYNTGHTGMLLRQNLIFERKCSTMLKVDVIFHGWQEGTMHSFSPNLKNDFYIEKRLLCATIVRFFASFKFNYQETVVC